MNEARSGAGPLTGQKWKKPPFIASPWLRYGLLIAVVVYLYWTFNTLPFNWDRIAEGLPRAARIFGGAFPPSFERGELMWTGFKESFQIAFLATLLGVFLSIPIALMAAKTLRPYRYTFWGAASSFCPAASTR